MPPDALHQSAKAWAAQGVRLQAGSIVLAASLNTAMLMVCPTPRTEEVPPSPVRRSCRRRPHADGGGARRQHRLDAVAAPALGDDSEKISRPELPSRSGER